MNKLQQVIESRFESVNQFCESIDPELMSKQTVYKLLKKARPNPTLSTVLTLAHYLKIDVLELIEVFKQMQTVEVVNNGTI
jgi:DNA-binding phage protein